VRRDSWAADCRLLSSLRHQAGKDNRALVPGPNGPFGGLLYVWVRMGAVRMALKRCHYKQPDRFRQPL